jgi:tripartite-type tricarboxylate transporter receptor subunit TctC
MAGQIDFSFLTPDFLPLVRAGSIRAYAVTSTTRLALAPDMPTFAEMGLPALSFFHLARTFRAQRQAHGPCISSMKRARLRNEATSARAKLQSNHA